jgi:hypothetical protein
MRNYVSIKNGELRTEDGKFSTTNSWKRRKNTLYYALGVERNSFLSSQNNKKYLSNTKKKNSEKKFVSFLFIEMNEENSENCLKKVEYLLLI